MIKTIRVSLRMTKMHNKMKLTKTMRIVINNLLIKTCKPVF